MFAVKEHRHMFGITPPAPPRNAGRDDGSDHGVRAEDSAVPLVSAALPGSARMVAPLIYHAPDGQQLTIPEGPCLLEELADNRVEVIWGATGQHSATLAHKDIEDAEKSGHLLLLG